MTVFEPVRNRLVHRRLATGRSIVAVATMFLVVVCWGCGSSSSSSSPPPPSTIAFSPSNPSLNNPTNAGQTTSASTLTLNLAALDTSGNPVTPSVGNPITVTVHGAPAGVISPVSTTITSGTTVTFSYNGQFFLHPLLVKASMPNGAGGQAATTGVISQAIGTTQILQQNPVCTYGPQSYTLNLSSPDFLNGLAIKAAVGYSSQRTPTFQDYTVDTGSLGVIVPAADLGPDAVGPGAMGVKLYDSSGNKYLGNYYLAPVSFLASNGTTVTTTPIQVLAVTNTQCAPDARECKTPPPNTLHYLGVGFDRNSSTQGDLFNSPAVNPFLHVDDAANGSDISPGYIFSGKNTQITLGMTSSGINGFSQAALTPNQSVPGDWNSAPGCFGFPNAATPNQFCGNLLLDVGISSMFLDLLSAQRPAGTTQTFTTPTGLTDIVVPTGTRTRILAGSPANPVMSYEFTSGSTVVPMAPVGQVTWINVPQVFVNTGRRVLAGFNYLYDAQCGQVGFQSAS